MEELQLLQITYFILIKGIKGTSYSNLEIDFFNGNTIKYIIEENVTQIVLYSTILWSLISMIAIKLFNVNIYKVIILIGTFALALAFAGNDLVNFIGVPIAGWQSL